MTDTDDALPPPQNLALIKGITVGLGVLLVGGVVLLGVLLLTRGDDTAPVAPMGDPVTYELSVGETLVGASQSGPNTLLTLRRADGSHRLVLLGQDDAVLREVVVQPAP